MFLQHVPSPADYRRLLEQDAEEPQRLLKDLLIGVTQFFRDSEAFEVVERQVLPRLFEGKAADDPVRLWVPGCASGEEAYSLAMLVREQLARLGSPRLVQIFATDIDLEFLATARAGRYGAEIAGHVTPERLESFFVQDGEGYRVVKELREMCIFSAHNLTRDPPFSSLDLISCRNVLIYFDAELQKKLVPLFHYALRPGGYLFLGPSEGLAGSAELFETVDERFRVYQRQEAAARPVVAFPVSSRPALSAPARTPKSKPKSKPEEKPQDPRQALARSFERLLLDDFAPCAALTNERGEILFVEGRTAPYFQIKPGAISSNVFDLVQGTLRLELHDALAAAVQARRGVTRTGVPVDVEGTLRRVRLSVRPMPGNAGVFAVVVQPMGATEPPGGDNESSALLTDQPAIEQLESELKATRADLKQAVEDLESAHEDFESANEELQSANEELQSANEELQSANEELQSSKEEMQSVNEELETVNTELHQKVQEIGTVNSDLANFFASTEIATLFLDRELRIAKFTPAATKLFSLIESDVGRPLGDLAPRFVGQDLVADAREVLQSLSKIERQVRSPEGGRWFILRARPYRTIEDAIAGVVVTFVDVTELKGAEEEVKRSRQGLRQLAEASLRVMQETSLEAMFQAISAAALKLTDAHIAVTGHGYVHGQFVVGGAARAPWIPDCPPGKAFAIEKGGVYMELLEGAGDTLRLTDEQMRAHPRWWGLPEGHTPMRGLLGVRLVDRLGRTNGMILASDKEQGEFTAEDESLLRQLGAMASLASQHVEARVSLEEADRSKNQFLAMLSHELRNPLAPVRNSLFILNRAAPGSEQAQRARTVIERQVEQMTRLVDDLLDVTRISRGKIQLQPESLDFADVVRRTVEDHRGLFTTNNLKLQVSIPDEPIRIRGDRTRIAQVIGNLLGNAAKFTQPGGSVTVTVEHNHQLQQAIARVRDTGAGIAPDVLPRIFEPFMQADASLDRSKGGLGLGLTLTKGIMDLHGGTASAVSEGLGKGTEFTVRFPLETGVPLTTKPTRGVRQTGPRRRVLVIEDNLDAAESLCEVLVLQGHKVERAFSGAEGIEKARTFQPEVVLCDIGLPGMDGYAVARTMRAEPELKPVALVALTGYAGPDEVARAIAAGFDHHLAKPPDIEKLEQILASPRPESPGPSAGSSQDGTSSR
jgi:two-component system, chemotaxis family, CheB/CheR fusion protein